MNKKMLEGLYRAPKNKRLKSFLTRAADTEEVWILTENAGKEALRQDEIYVWPHRELAEMYNSSAMVVMMDVHDFIEECQARVDEADFIIRVFANDEDTCDVAAAELIESLQEELDLIE